MFITLCGGYFFNDLREMITKLTVKEDAQPKPQGATPALTPEVRDLKAKIEELQMLRGGASAQVQQTVVETAEEAIDSGSPPKYTGPTDYRESGDISSVRPKFKRLKKKAGNKRYCVPIDGKPDKTIVGTLSVRGFCQRRPTFFELCLASGMLYFIILCCAMLN
jgi:hypothetical protein